MPTCVRVCGKYDNTHAHTTLGGLNSSEGSTLSFLPLFNKGGREQEGKAKKQQGAKRSCDHRFVWRRILFWGEKRELAGFNDLVQGKEIRNMSLLGVK